MPFLHVTQAGWFNLPVGLLTSGPVVLQAKLTLKDNFFKVLSLFAGSLSYNRSISNPFFFFDYSTFKHSALPILS